MFDFIKSPWLSSTLSQMLNFLKIIWFYILTGLLSSVENASGGFFSKKIHRFYFRVGTREFKYEGSWTREEFRSLEGQQKKIPVPLTTENGSGETWWIFQDAIYREDYSAREVHNKRRSRLEVMSEVKAIFF